MATKKLPKRDLKRHPSWAYLEILINRLSTAEANVADLRTAAQAVIRCAKMRGIGGDVFVAPPGFLKPLMLLDDLVNPTPRPAKKAANARK